MEYFALSFVTPTGNLTARVFSSMDVLEEFVEENGSKQAILFIVKGEVEMLTHNGKEWQDHADLIEGLDKAR